jgi:hypothetical protein
MFARHENIAFVAANGEEMRMERESRGEVESLSLIVSQVPWTSWWIAVRKASRIFLDKVPCLGVKALLIKVSERSL